MTNEWTPADVPDLGGQRIVVTGANSGLGFEATKSFARTGATVIMACRTEERGVDAAHEIREAVPGADLDPRACDLASLDSIAAFAESCRSDYDGLDVLCNNAGVMAIPRAETDDGFEEQLGVNHLGHFALTGRLLGLLLASDGESRVVTQSSGLHERGEMDFEDLQSERSYDKWAAYGQSKLANLLFAYELDRRAGAADADLVSVGCHPGYADTSLQSRGPRRAGSRVRLGIMRVVNAIVAQSPAIGAEPLVYAATAETIEGGEYVGPGGLFNMRGHPSIQTSNDASYDEADADRLWTVSEELTGVAYDLADAKAAVR